MVWLNFIFVILIFSSNLYSLELSQEEIDYFNIIDLNNDGFVSIEEINQSTNLIFQLIDINNDKKISQKELEELKKIIKILK